MTGAPATRARADHTGPAERARLRAELGTLLRTERIARGMTQDALAAAAGYHRTAVARLECGVTRPSESSTRRLAEALRPAEAPVDVAVLDLQLQRAAGASLRRWRRRKPWSARRQRVYARAAELLECPRPDPAGAVVAGFVLAELERWGRADGTQ